MSNKNKLTDKEIKRMRKLKQKQLDDRVLIRKKVLTNNYEDATAK